MSVELRIGKNHIVNSKGIVKVICLCLEWIHFSKIFWVLTFWALIPQEEQSLPLQVWGQKITSSSIGQTKTEEPRLWLEQLITLWTYLSALGLRESIEELYLE